jgi:inward rectifier potassium channel
MARTQAGRSSKPASDYEVRVVGAQPTPLRDFYHALMRLSWPETLAVIAVGYLVMNALFACGYFWIGGVSHTAKWSFLYAFFFSVQTMGTIGYGAMYPDSDAANALVVLESLSGLLLTALATGLVFSKFSIPTARLAFSKHATVSPINGVQTLAFRLGNLRSNRIVQAQIRVAIVRTEQTHEGHTFYRMLDLRLTRDRALSLTRAWTVHHPIDESSPLYGETPESLAEKDVEIDVTVVGIDDIWMQSVHSVHRYMHDEIVWNARLADVLSESDDVITLDLTKFHEVVSLS